MHDDSPLPVHDGTRLNAAKLPGPIAAVLLSERRRDNLMIADMLRERAGDGPLARLRFHAASAVSGFATGALFVVPVLIWGLWISPPVAPMGKMPVAQRTSPTVASLEQPMSLRAPDTLSLRATSPQSNEIDTDAAHEMLERRIGSARLLLANGQVRDARAMLVETSIAGTPEGAFALAETYDPNILAALNLTGVAAEVDHARRLYTSALIGGIEPARQRLQALQ